MESIVVETAGDREVRQPTPDPPPRGHASRLSRAAHPVPAGEDALLRPFSENTMAPASLHNDSSALGTAHTLLTHALEWSVLAVNAACALVLLWGVAVGLTLLARIQFQPGCDPETHWPMLRRRVGRYILFGLELLIAADIIETMAQPTLEQLALLGGVSVLRIVTGYALSKELEHLPTATPRQA